MPEAISARRSAVPCRRRLTPALGLLLLAAPTLPAQKRSSPERAAADKSAESTLRGIHRHICEVAAKPEWGAERLAAKVRLKYYGWDDIDAGRHPKGNPAILYGPKTGPNRTDDWLVAASVELFHLTAAADSELERNCKLGIALAHEVSHVVKKHGPRGMEFRSALARQWLKKNAEEPYIRALVLRIGKARDAGLKDEEAQKLILARFDEDNRKTLDAKSREFESEADAHGFRIMTKTDCYEKVPPATLSSALDRLSELDFHYGAFYTDSATHGSHSDRAQAVLLMELGNRFR